MSGNKVLIRQEGAVCSLTMNSPKKMNALDGEMIGELQSALDDISAGTKTRVVTLEGAGGNFCSGADLSFLGSGMDKGNAYQTMERVNRLIGSLRELAQPVVCKVQGVAYGGGANLALAGDLVVASPGARISQAFVNIGLTLDCGGTYFLPRLVGMTRARALGLLGEEVDGKTAASMGLIYKCCADEELEQEVASLAGTLAAKSLPALSAIKKGLNRSLNMTLDEALSWEASTQAELLQSEEFTRALQALIQAKKKKL